MTEEDRSRPTRRPSRTWGQRVTERLLTYVGPAQVGDPAAPARQATADERAREQSLRTSWVREVAADGTAYLVERPAAD